MEIIDPYAYMTTVVYVIALAGLGLVGSFLRISRRGKAWKNLHKPLAAAKRAGGGTFGPLPGKKREFAVYSKGAKVARVDPSTDNADFKPVEEVALVKDMDRQTGLVLRTGGDDICVSGLEPMARIWSWMQRDDPSVSFVFRDDEATTMKGLIGSLHSGQREMLGRWMAENEIITDIVHGVEYEGKLASRGSKGAATLIVTNFRVGLLADTVETQHHQKSVRTVMHANLIGFPLPLAERVVLERKPSLRKERYLLRLELPPEHQKEDTPTLRLTKDHAGVLLPILVFKRPLEVVVSKPSLVAWIASSLSASWIWMIAYGVLGAILAVMWSEAEGSFYERYLFPLVIAGMLSPLVMRALRLLEVRVEHARYARAHSTSS